MLNRKINKQITAVNKNHAQWNIFVHNFCVWLLIYNIDPYTSLSYCLLHMIDASYCSPHCSPGGFPFHLSSLTTATEVHVYLLYSKPKKQWVEVCRKEIMSFKMVVDVLKMIVKFKKCNQTWMTQMLINVSMQNNPNPTK